MDLSLNETDHADGIDFWPGTQGLHSFSSFQDWV